MSKPILTGMCLLALAACDAPQPAVPPASLAAMLAGDVDTGFKQADAAREFQFPEDHGAHPEYKTEWWYFTGNVQTDTGREFGYQFTLFRYAVAPGAGDKQALTGSRWSTAQIYMAHAALSDIESGKFYHDEQFSRGALALAGAESPPFKLWLHQWAVAGQTEQCPGCLAAAISIPGKNFSLQLQLDNSGPPVLHGRQGLSTKSAEPGHASYYYSYTRLQTAGRIVLNDTAYPVSGTGWYDHEWSSSALERGQAGWDWFGLQLAGQTEIMIYRLRHGADPKQDYIYGSLISAGDGLQTLNGAAIRIQTLDTWRSATSGVTYPAGWYIELPGYHLTITPKMHDQEITGDFRYWEGAARISGDAGGRPVSGQGYVELTGYR